MYMSAHHGEALSSERASKAIAQGGYLFNEAPNEALFQWVDMHVCGKKVMNADLQRVVHSRDPSADRQALTRGKRGNF
jgi:hypothetical protein